MVAARTRRLPTAIAPTTHRILGTALIVRPIMAIALTAHRTMVHAVAAATPLLAVIRLLPVPTRRHAVEVTAAAVVIVVVEGAVVVPTVVAGEAGEPAPAVVATNDFQISRLFSRPAPDLQSGPPFFSSRKVSLFAPELTFEKLFVLLRVTSSDTGSWSGSLLSKDVCQEYSSGDPVSRSSATNRCACS